MIRTAALAAIVFASVLANGGAQARKGGPAAANLDVPSGAYTLEKSHATLIFSVDHLGFSNYRAAFTNWDVKLSLDVANPAKSSVEASVDLTSLQLQGAPKGFKEELIGPNWINTPKTASAVFKSTSVKLTGPRSARVTGDLTLNGVTKPVEMRMRLNGGYRGHPMDPQARVGFSGEGVFKRSAFGISAGIPAPGSTMGVGDDVRFSIEAELIGPPMKQ